MNKQFTGKRRFNAEWIVKQHHDENGEWNPDLDEYVCSTHKTFEAAKQAAILQSKKAHVVEWWRVEEEEITTIDGCAPMWDTVRTWTGDWEGNCEESRWS